MTEILGGHIPVFYGHFYKETYLTVQSSLTWRSLVPKGCEGTAGLRSGTAHFYWTSGSVLLFIESHSPWGLGTELELRMNMEDKLRGTQGLARTLTF